MEMEDSKVEGVPDLDDLLQCPVCYEIPTGQIFQCNEGHHVCGRCKLRLDVCPVCRAFFFGTRNYAMEELIANVRKLRTFKLGGKVTTGTNSASPSNEEAEVKESTSEENSTNNDEDDVSSRSSLAPPAPCSGLFRCLCCKINPERLPSARLLNHLRYFHSPELIEGRSENGEYVQAWQFSTENGRIVTAIRVADMGLFFLVIEITNDTVFAWLAMAASPVVAEEFSYTFTLSGNDREAIFSDCVWSVRTCEGFLKKRERCLSISGANARALLSPTTMNAKLSLRRTPIELVPNQGHPRAILRVANRSHQRESTDAPELIAQNLEPFLQDLQNDVARLSRAFATLGREANALVRSEADMRARELARLENSHPRSAAVVTPPEEPLPVASAQRPEPVPEPQPLSRNARRRMRQRLREAFREAQSAEVSANVSRQVEMIIAASPPHRTPSDNNVARENSAQNNNNRVQTDQTANDQVGGQQNANSARNNTTRNRAAPRPQNSQGDRANNNRQRENVTHVSDEPIIIQTGFAIVEEVPVAAPAAPSTARASGNGNGGRNKRKRRQRR